MPDERNVMDGKQIRSVGPVRAARDPGRPQPRPAPADPDPRWVHRMVVIVDRDGQPVAVADSPDSAAQWIARMLEATPGDVFIAISDVPTVLTSRERQYERDLLHGDPATAMARRDHEAGVLRRHLG